MAPSDTERRILQLERENRGLRALLAAGSSHQRPYLRDVLDSIFAFAAVLTVDGILVEANRAAREAANLLPEDVLGLPFEETYWWSYSPEARKQLREAMERAAGGEGCRYDTRLRVGEGRFVAVDFALAPQFSEDGSVQSIVASAVDVTEREEARLALAAGEEVLQATFEWAPLGLAHVAVDGRFLRVNPKLCEMTGYTPSELEQLSLEEMCHGSDRTANMAHIANLLEGGSDTYSLEKRILRRDGQALWVNLTVSLLRGPEQAPRFLIAIFEDVSGRRAAAEALRDRERRLNVALKAGQMGTWDYDLASGTLKCPDSTDLLFGFEPGGARALEDYIARVHPEDLERVKPLIGKSLQQGLEHDIEFRLLVPGGPTRWLASRGEVIRDAEGNPTGLTGAVIDVTARKATEEQLRGFVESNVIGILFGDIYGRIYDCNEAMCGLIGYSRDEIRAGKVRWDTITPSEYLALDQAKIAEARAGGACAPYEKEYLRRDGARVPVLIGFTLVGSEKERLVAFILDISERKRAAAELERQARELARSNAELRQFAYVASHDLQEPLRMVVSYTQFLARRYKGRLDSDADQFIEYAVEGALRMEKLLRSILEYSQAGADDSTVPARVDSNAALQTALSNLESAVRSSAAEITAQSLPPVLAREIPVSQVFQNLISNAIKYRSPDRAPQIRITAEADGEMHRFAVCDNGIGIDAQHKDRIFRIFKRLHGSQYPGTGIGLAICARIVERYGGRIWVDSEPGEGSCFQFTLPAAP